MKKFDLNIESILENWEIYHAIREIIANALDETLLTNADPVEIFKRGDAWVIRDYGRGLKYTHLTQNENAEKLANPYVIGRFGIGLKDAMATLDRNGIKVSIKSKFGLICTEKLVKQGFEDIITLHATIEEPEDPNFIGTEFELAGVLDDHIVSAKALFLIFSGEHIIDTTRQGQIVARRSADTYGNIYIHGVKVAEEENFLFSYNITALSAATKKALNRERSNVGRTAYTDSVKKILLSSHNREVAQQLGADLAQISSGTAHDELNWIDVQEHAAKILNQQGNYLFLTPSQAMSSPDMIDYARQQGLTTVTVTENLGYKISGSTDHAGTPITDFTHLLKSYENSFVFNFVEPSRLTHDEREVFALTPKIIQFFGGLPQQVKQVKISSTMRSELSGFYRTLGCWDSSTSSIVVLQDTLRSIDVYCGVLLHELVHAKTGYSDVTRDFETALTNCMGMLCASLLKSHVNLSENQDVSIVEKENIKKEREELMRTKVIQAQNRVDLLNLKKEVAREKIELGEERKKLSAIEQCLTQQRAQLLEAQCVLSRQTADAEKKRQSFLEVKTSFDQQCVQSLVDQQAVVSKNANISGAQEMPVSGQNSLERERSDLAEARYTFAREKVDFKEQQERLLSAMSALNQERAIFEQERSKLADARNVIAGEKEKIREQYAELAVVKSALECERFALNQLREDVEKRVQQSVDKKQEVATGAVGSSALPNQAPGDYRVNEVKKAAIASRKPWYKFW